MASNRCVKCQVKHAQSHGLCRACEHQEKGHRSTKERDAERVARHDALIARLPHAEERPKPNRSYVFGGVEYEVTWDGTC